MVETFELYIEGTDDQRRFRALTCEPSELMSKVRDIVEDEMVRAAEVRQFGQAMFTLVR